MWKRTVPAPVPLADITRADVQRWFASRRATPVAADRSMPVLSVIMKEAERMGYRPEGSNPCRGIRRYRRKGRERFLSDAEIGSLAARLSAHEGGLPLEVAAVRLLLLTGCRKSEVLTLRWSDYCEGHLFLRDGKTGPGTVWLSRAARNVLGNIDRTGAWVFPARRANEPAGPVWLRYFWHRVRAEADLSDVRLHDLRHYSGIRLIPGLTPEAGGERARWALVSGIITGCSGKPARRPRAGIVRAACSPPMGGRIPVS